MQMWLPWAVVALMFGVSALAFLQTHAGAQLPMQWGLTGKVGWRAPRVIAVLFTPVLAVGVLAFATAIVPGGVAQRIFPYRLLIALMLLGAHIAHLFFALRNAGERR